MTQIDLAENATEKLYYETPDLVAVTAKVTSVGDTWVVTDRTVCFAEGGGQVGDLGWVAGLEIRDTRKRGGYPVVRQGLPMVNVGTEVVHQLNEPANGLQVGQEVEVRTDLERRVKCSRLHTAIHLVMGQVNRLFGKESYQVKGCLIGPDKARIDFQTDQKLGGPVLGQLQEGVDGWVSSGAKVWQESIPDVPEMFLWRCEADHDLLDQPCGGTHVTTLDEVGAVRLKRKNEGRRVERIYVEPLA